MKTFSVVEVYDLEGRVNGFAVAYDREAPVAEFFISGSCRAIMQQYRAQILCNYFNRLEQLKSKSQQASTNLSNNPS